MILHFQTSQITKQGIYKDLFVDYRILGYPSSDSNGCRCIEVPDDYHTSSELLELVNNGIEVQQCPMFLLTTQTELDNFQASLEEPIIFDREHTVVEDKILVLLNTPGRHMEGSEWLQFIGMGEFKTLAEANVLLEPLNTI